MGSAARLSLSYPPVVSYPPRPPTPPPTHAHAHAPPAPCAKRVVRLLDAPGVTSDRTHWTLLGWDFRTNDAVVYNSLLHDVVLKTYMTAIAMDDDNDAQKVYERGLAVAQYVCEQRPAAVVDL